MSSACLSNKPKTKAQAWLICNKWTWTSFLSSWAWVVHEQLGLFTTVLQFLLSKFVHHLLEQRELVSYIWAFWIFPRHNTHTFLASGHSHNTCSVDSVHWQHSPHVRSTCILHLWRFSQVGRIFEQACQRKLRTFGGAFSFQIFLHIGRSNLALECSLWALSWSLNATWYVDFTVKLLLLFSYQTRLSLPMVFWKGIDRISILVL